MRVARLVACAILHRGGVGGCSVRCRRRGGVNGVVLLVFTHLQRHGGEADVGRAGTPNSHGSSAGMRCHGESFTH
jgi:hypothetical protein